MRFRPDAGAAGSRAASGRRSAAGGIREAGDRIFRGVRKCREDRLAPPTVNRPAAASLPGMAGIQGRPPFDDACDCSFVDSGERGGGCSERTGPGRFGGPVFARAVRRRGHAGSRACRGRGLPVGSGIAKAPAIASSGTGSKEPGAVGRNRCQRPARQRMPLRKHARTRLPRMEGLPSGRRPTKENGPHPQKT